MRTAALALASLAACATPRAAGPPAPKPPTPRFPETRRGDDADTLHGTRVEDPYRWLEDENAPAVRAWMEAQDAFARGFLASLPGREALRARLREVLDVETMGVPLKRGNRLFYARRQPGQEKAAVWVREPTGTERPLLDPNAWPRERNVSLGRWSVSWDGRTVAYQERPNAADEATLRVIDVDTGRVSATDVIPGAKYATASFTPDGTGFYYTWIPTDPRIPAAERPGYQEVRFHRLGTDPARDSRVRERTGDPRTFLRAELSRDGHWLVLTVWFGWAEADVFFRDARRGPAEPFRPLAVGRKALFDVEVHRDIFYVLTNEGAPRWHLFAVDPARPGRESWREIVPEGEGTLKGASVVGGSLALEFLEKAASRLEIRALDGRRLREVPLPALGTASALSGLPEEDEAYFSFESFTWPREIRRVSIATGISSTLFRTRVPVDPARLEVEQVFFPSRDGTRLSMFLVHPRGAARDGSAPAILHGYGGFQVALTPQYSGAIFPWLERGGLYAVANLRGGSEYGERWHEEGMLTKKQNVVDDFVAAAEFLEREGWTRPARLAILGGSNGGLLVGAAMIQRPALFAAVLCAVPLLDMVRYHLFGSGKTWIAEYGSADDPEQFRALQAYSPYHHVTRGTLYPWLLLLSSDHDDRVDPMHARKFAAAVQAATTGGPVLLRIERQAGHGGADLLRAEVEQRADELAFALAAMGVRP